MYDFNIPGWAPQRRQVEFVNGIDSARMYRLGPGESAVLMDADADRFYLVQADAVGATRVRSYDFREHVEEAVAPPDYVRRDEIAGIVREELERWSGGNEQHQ